MLILYPVTLLNSFISFCVESLGFSVLSIMPSEYTDSVTSFLSNLDTFYFFSSLIAVARSSKTMLNNIVMKVDTLVLFLILGGMLSVFHH